MWTRGMEPATFPWVTATPVPKPKQTINAALLTTEKVCTLSVSFILAILCADLHTREKKGVRTSCSSSQLLAVTSTHAPLTEERDYVMRTSGRQRKWTMLATPRRKHLVTVIRSAVTWLMLSRLGQKKVSQYIDRRCDMEREMNWNICAFSRTNLPPLRRRGLFLTFSWQFDIWTIPVCATVNWHNCQLLLSTEFLFLIPVKTPAAWELRSVHKPQGPNTLLICLLGENKFTFPRKTTAILWDHPATLLSTTPLSHTLLADAEPPPESHFLLYVALIGGVLVNQSCQNINGSSRDHVSCQPNWTQSAVISVRWADRTTRSRGGESVSAFSGTKSQWKYCHTRARGHEHKFL